MPIKCIQFKNSTDKQELYFYGDIVSDAWGKWLDTDTCPEDVQNILSQVDETRPLDIYINSGGGSVFAGLAIYSMLKRSKSKKTVYVDALAGSIASIIAMAGDEIIIPSNAFLMIHKPWAQVAGNANDMRKMSDDLDRIEEGLLNIYSEKLADGVDLEVIKQMVNAETWLNGTDAAKYFRINVGQPSVAAASISNLSNYEKAPKSLIKNDTGCMCGTCPMQENCDPSNAECNCVNCSSNDSCEKKTNQMSNKLEVENLKAKLNLELL